ncbi:Secreted protein [Chryseobacterium sp. IT-36CA2]
MKNQSSLKLIKSLQIHSFGTYNLYRLLPLIVCFINTSVFGQISIIPLNCNGNLTNTFKFDFVTPVCANSTTFDPPFTNQEAAPNMVGQFDVDILNVAGNTFQSIKWKLVESKWLILRY